MKMLCNRVDDRLGGNLSLCIRRDQVAENFLGEIKRHITFFKNGLGPDTVQTSFQFTDIGLDVLGDVIQHFVVDVVSVCLFLFSQDGHSRLVIR